MRISSLVILTTMGLVSFAQPVLAQTCGELWYERNQIYDDNGFCFNTRDGRRAFDNSDCYTDNPNFSRGEQRRIDEIRREEKYLGCG